MKRSAGLLPYRHNGALLEVLLAHPGGPFWEKKDAGAWTIPKGEIHAGEDPLLAAQREFREETGSVAEGPFLALGSVAQSAAKTVFAWACELDLDPELCVSNTIEMEWPPRSGRSIEVPEIDRVAWFSLEEAARRILPGQKPFLDRLRSLSTAV